MTEGLHFHFSLSCIKEGKQPTPVFLPGESQGWGSLVGCPLWGHTELDTTEVLAAVGDIYYYYFYIISPFYRKMTFRLKDIK